MPRGRIAKGRVEEAKERGEGRRWHSSTIRIGNIEIASLPWARHQAGQGFEKAGIHLFIWHMTGDWK